MRISLVLLLLALVYANTSCRWLKEPDKAVFAVVICDASNSATKFSQNKKAYFDSLVSKIHLLPNTLPPNSVLFFIPVASNQFRDALGGVPYETKMVNDAEGSNLKKSQRQFLDTVCTQLLSIAGSDAASSCLLTSINNAYNIIQSYKANTSYSKHEFQIIILSDMMENCSSNSVGTVNMEDISAQNISANLAAIKNYTTDINLDKDTILVRPILLTPGITNKHADLLKSYWRKLLQKMNYDSTQLRFESPASLYIK